MRYLIAAIATASVLTLSVGFLRAEDAAKDAKASVSGVLIDNACAPKFLKKDDPEGAAAGHPKACAMKESCAASGYGVISGKELIKFDENGNKLAKEYFEKNDSTKVTVEGTRSGNEIAVTEIKAAEQK